MADDVNLSEIITEDQAVGMLTDDAEEPIAPEETAEGDTSEDSEQAEGAEAEEPEEEPEYEVKTPKGQEKVKLSELLRGYQRQSDYSRKTEEAAQLRREAESYQAAVAQKEQQLMQALETWAVPTTQEPDWVKLAQNTTPQEFNLARAQWDDRQRRASMARNEYHALQAAQRAENEQRERAQLFDKVPDLRDAAKATAFARELIEAGPSYGFTAEELNGIQDHRLMLLFRDALAHRKLQATKPAVAKKIADAPQKLKPGTKAKPDATVDRQKLIERLRRTGDMRDAAALL